MEKEMATHSSVLALRIPGMGEPGRLLPMGLHRVGHNCSDLAAAAEPPGKCVYVCVCVWEREIECVYKDTENSLFSSLQIFFFVTNAWDEVPQNLLEVK